MRNKLSLQVSLTVYLLFLCCCFTFACVYVGFLIRRRRSNNTSRNFAVAYAIDCANMGLVKFYYTAFFFAFEFSLIRNFLRRDSRI